MRRLTDGVRGVILSCEKLCFKSCVPEKNHKAMDKLGTLLSPPQPPLLRTTDSACRTRRGVFFLKARIHELATRDNWQKERMLPFFLGNLSFKGNLPIMEGEV